MNQLANEQKKATARLLSKLLRTHAENGREALRARLLQDHSELEAIKSEMSNHDCERFEEIGDLLELLVPCRPA